MDQTLIKRIVEAALLAANQPLGMAQLQGLFPLDEPAPEGAIGQALHALQEDAADRGVELVEIASGWRYQVCADVHPWVARLWTERQTKYTRATLETLALVAYRQPITRGEIEQVRGVAVNSNIIKALEEREWIRVVGHRDVPGRPELLGTTKGFLDYFGLKRLDELPALSELKDFGELDPQLQFEGTPPGEVLPVGDVPTHDAHAEDSLGRDDREPLDDDEALGESDDESSANDARPTPVDDADDLMPEHDSIREERIESDPAIAAVADRSDQDDGFDTDADSDTESETDTEIDAAIDTGTEIDTDQPSAADADDESDPNHDSDPDTDADTSALADDGDSTRSTQ